MAFGAGYLVVNFDYRGCGGSDSRVILTAPEPSEHPGGKFTVEVEEVPEVVDPIDEAPDCTIRSGWGCGSAVFGRAGVRGGARCGVKGSTAR